jgi:hypothetical protein
MGLNPSASPSGTLRMRGPHPSKKKPRTAARAALCLMQLGEAEQPGFRRTQTARPQFYRATDCQIRARMRPSLASLNASGRYSASYHKAGLALADRWAFGKRLHIVMRASARLMTFWR